MALEIQTYLEKSISCMHEGVNCFAGKNSWRTTESNPELLKLNISKLTYSLWASPPRPVTIRVPESNSRRFRFQAIQIRTLILVRFYLTMKIGFQMQFSLVLNIFEKVKFISKSQYKSTFLIKFNHLQPLRSLFKLFD